MMRQVYRGWLVEASWGEAYDILYLTPDRARIGPEPLAEQIEFDMGQHGAMLTVRYFISDKEETPETITASVAQVMSGMGYADVGHHYSEITGYLYTDEMISVGGHNLIEELRSFNGKWCHLEIDFAPIR